MQGDPDIAVIGSGPNGLVAACLLAQRGFRVAVLEAHPRRPGGVLGTEEVTLPGFTHDVGPGTFPMADSPALRSLALPSTGLRWQHAPLATCHLASDGSCAALGRDVGVTAAHFDSEEDAGTWRSLAARHQRRRGALDEILLGPFPPVRSLLRLDPRDLLHLARVSLSGASSLGQRWFVTEAARQVFADLALQAHRPPSERRSGLFGYFLALEAASRGFPLPAGGARSLANALVTVLERHGGQLLLGSAVQEIIVRRGRVVAVRLRTGRDQRGPELAVSRGVLADVPWTTLLLELVAPGWWPSRALRRARDARRSPVRTTTVQLHWALGAPVPWSSDAARRSAVVHSARWALTQPSLFDPGRAPPGRHTASCSARFTADALNGGAPIPEAVAPGLEEHIEALAPGFRARILGRHATLLERGDPSLPYLPYATSVRGLYLCSDDTRPGPGVHGMCGAHAARRAAHDLG